jgi:hypothetical protein
MTLIETLIFLKSDDFMFYVFPFLILHSMIYAVLMSKGVKFFQNKKTGKYNKPMVILVSAIFSLFGTIYETKSGYGLSYFMSLLFPTLSIITLLVLGLYLIGGIFAKDFIRGFLRKDISAITTFIIFAFILGFGLYFLLVFIGVLTTNVYDTQAMMLFTLSVGLIISGLIMVALEDIRAIGLILLLIGYSAALIFGEGDFLEVFQDPGLIVLIIFILGVNYMISPQGKKEEEIFYNKKVKEYQEEIKKRNEENGGKAPEEYTDKIYDMIDQSRIDSENKLKNLK